MLSMSLIVRGAIVMELNKKKCWNGMEWNQIAILLQTDGRENWKRILSSSQLHACSLCLVYFSLYVVCEKDAHASA
jgi:hypothetical protein